MVYPRLARSMASYCGDPAVGEEIAQEALARAWERWDAVSAMDAPAMWVYRTGLNLARSHWRRRLRERRSLERSGLDRFTAAAPEQSWADSVAVRQAIARLPSRQRSAVVLRYHGDLSVDDTARVMGCAAGTVKALTHQALDRLRAELGNDDVVQPR